MKSLKVLAVIPGKEEDLQNMNFAKNEVKVLRRLGQNVEIFHLRSRNFSPYTFKEWRRLNNKVNEFQPDILHAHYGTVTGLMVALFPRQTRIVCFRGNDLNPDPGLPLLRRWLGWLMSQIAAVLCEGVIFVSRPLQQKLLIKPDKFIVAASGIDLEKFRPLDKLESKKAIGLNPESSYVFFYSGSNAKVKRCDLALEVVKLAKNKSNNIELLQLDGSIRHDQIPIYLNSSDCVILTSQNEGSPTVVKEALACQVPVVTFDVGDVRELLKNDPTSVVIEDRSVERMSEAVVKISNEPIRKLSNKKVDHLNEESVVKRIMKFYIACLDIKGSRG